MSMGYKIAIAVVIGVVLISVFTSDVQRFLTRLTSSSRTVVVADNRGVDGSGAVGSQRELEMVTLLGFDGIPAILDPQFVTAEQAETWIEPGDPVLGLDINGDRRAYSVTMLSAHEIVNDVVGGVPVAITW